MCRSWFSHVERFSRYSIQDRAKVVAMTRFLVDYDPTWPIQFEEERRLLLSAIQEHVKEIQHIGSTAIPGLCAKPKIDILIGLSNLSLVTACIEPLEQLQYTYGGENGSERHYFRKPLSREISATHHLHLVEFGSEQWRHPLFFRDYLRTHPATALEYGLFKKQLVAWFGGYSSGDKSVFIRSILQKRGKT